MNDCPIGICIPAAAMNGHNWFFVRDCGRNAQTTGVVKLIDAAVASACARRISTIGPHGERAGARVFRRRDWRSGLLTGLRGDVRIRHLRGRADPSGVAREVLSRRQYAAERLIDVVSWATDTLVDSSEAGSRPGASMAWQAELRLAVAIGHRHGRPVRHSGADRGRKNGRRKYRLEANFRRVA
jgi:hypothetical protein